MPAGHPVGDVLRLLADCDSTGALQVAGPPRGTFYLEQGSIVGVETDAVPPGADPPAVLDAAVEILRGPATMPPRFTTGVRIDPGTALRCDVDQLLADVGRAVDRLDRAGVGADDSVVVRPLAGRGVCLDATAWPIVDPLTRPTTPRQVAWALGVPVIGVVLAVGDLIDQGAVAVVRVAVRPGSSPDLPRSRFRPAEDSIPPGPAALPAPSASGSDGPGSDDPGSDGPGSSDARDQAPTGVLPVRRPGAALREAKRRSPGLPRRQSPRAGQITTGVAIAQPEPELVLRLLDGLRRL